MKDFSYFDVEDISELDHLYSGDLQDFSTGKSATLDDDLWLEWEGEIPLDDLYE